MAMKFESTGHIEVLTVLAENEDTIDVFIHNPVTHMVLRETSSSFAHRCCLPHTQLFEVRSCYQADSRIHDHLWYLQTIPYNNKRRSTETFREYEIAFQEIWLIATGYYNPNLKEMQDLE